MTEKQHFRPTQGKRIKLGWIAMFSDRLKQREKKNHHVLLHINDYGNNLACHLHTPGEARVQIPMQGSNSLKQNFLCHSLWQHLAPHVDTY